MTVYILTAFHDSSRLFRKHVSGITVSALLTTYNLPHYCKEIIFISMLSIQKTRFRVYYMLEMTQLTGTPAEYPGLLTAPVYLLYLLNHDRLSKTPHIWKTGQSVT